MPKDVAQYVDYNTCLRKVKWGAKKLYYIHKCAEFKHNTRKLWGTINKICGKSNDKAMCIESLKVNNVTTYNTTKITDSFGKYFASVGKRYADNIEPPRTNVDQYLLKIRMSENSIFLNPVTYQELDKLIDKLPNKVSSGYNNISNILLKNIKPLIVSPLVGIFNSSLTTGVFSKLMKTAIVVPLHKGQSTLELSNYRPISLLLTISKLLEKVMYTQVYYFLSRTNQIYESQYGFRANHLCEHAIGELLSEITKSMELGKQTVSAFLDLSKAFDTLEHSVIFRKFEKYGLCGPCLEWFKSYLSGRTLKVRCNTGNGVGLSKEYDVTYGAPEGSCLGSLIFLVFCNDLHLHLMYLEVLQFADDTTLYLSHKHIGYLRFCFETDLANIQDWFNANKLTLNITKSVLMHFNAKGTRGSLTVKIGNAVLLVVKNTKFLGVYIDENFNWNEHAKHLQLKLKSRSCLLNKGK